MTDTYPGRWVGHCTCAGNGVQHEASCGWDIDDRPTAAGPIAALPYAAVPTSPVAGLAGPRMDHGDLIVLTEWMAGPGHFDAADIAEAVRKPWKWEDELAEAREWQAEQIAKLARGAAS